MKSITRCVLLLVLAFAFLPAATAHGAEQQGRPNILFILVDDMGWRDLACYGHEIHETPNIDQLGGRWDAIHKRLRGLSHLRPVARRHHDREVPVEHGLRG